MIAVTGSTGLLGGRVAQLIGQDGNIRGPAEDGRALWLRPTLPMSRLPF